MTSPQDKGSERSGTPAGMYVNPKTLWFHGSGVWALVIAVGAGASAFTAGVNDMKHLVSGNGTAIEENRQSIEALSKQLDALQLQIAKQRE